MRVIGGKYHGMKLKGVKGKDFRPTTQMVKGAILDSLYGDIQGGEFLDLYAGSGGVGIEALSRGARRAIFVEKKPNALEALYSNIKKCGIAPGYCSVIKSDARDYLKAEAAKGKEYEVIFADPPYSGDSAGEILNIVCSLDYRICRILIIESGEELDAGRECPDIRRRTKKYGQTFVNYFRF
jgi:16S rRNA (guanine966-N2)-methyltransferase